MARARRILSRSCLAYSANKPGRRSMAESKHRTPHHNRNAYDPARQRLRELERAIRAHSGGEPDQFLPPVARALLLIQRNRGATLGAAELLDRLEVWAQTHAPAARKSQLQEATSGAIGRPFLDKADPLARRIGLTYASRQRLRIRTIGSCDVDKRARAQLAKLRKRKRERARSAAKRRAAGAATRQEFLATNCLSRTQPWLAAGTSRRTWYRRQTTFGTGPLPVGTGPLPSPDDAIGTGPSPHISLTARQTTCANAVTPAAPARRTGNRRALPAQSEPPALARDGGRRSASAPHSAVASGPPANPGDGTPDLFLGKPDGAAGIEQASNGVSALCTRDDRGQQMLLLQRWGATPRKAQSVIADCYTKIPQRTIKDAFRGASLRAGSNKNRLQWLIEQMRRASRDPHGYRVPTRAPRPSDGTAVRAILRIFAIERKSRLTTVEIHAALPKRPYGTIKARLASMIRKGQLRRVQSGLYEIPDGANDRARGSLASGDGQV